MLRILTACFFARAILASPFVPLCVSLAVAKDEMTSSLLIGNARIEIRIEEDTLRLPARDVFRWVKSAAASVTSYYGRFPLPQVLIQITPFEMPAEDLPRELHDGVALRPGDAEWIERGGSAIIGSDSRYVREPVFDREELLVSDLDLTQIDREMMTFDVSGHYARPDLFRFEKKV